jgi:formate/nitrite transporter
MSYVKPDAVVENMIQAGSNKASLSIKDLLIRGFLSGALLGFATTLAYSALLQTKLGIVGALIFPVGFVMIVLLGLELVTGNFALLPLPMMEGKLSPGKMLGAWGWVFLGNLIGSLFYAWLFCLTTTPDSDMAAQLIKVAEAKTLGYQKLGMHGMEVVFVKAILCNWMVTMGVVMALTSQSTIGKITAMWLPILTFFAQGFEHSVVNMFVIPAGMMMGAKVSLADWWMWNQIPVTVGNIVGGAVFTGLALYLTHHKRPVPAVSTSVAAQPVPALRNEPEAMAG